MVWYGLVVILGHGSTKISFQLVQNNKFKSLISRSFGGTLKLIKNGSCDFFFSSDPFISQPSHSKPYHTKPRHFRPIFRPFWPVKDLFMKRFVQYSKRFVHELTSAMSQIPVLLLNLNALHWPSPASSTCHVTLLSHHPFKTFS